MSTIWTKTRRELRARLPWGGWEMFVRPLRVLQEDEGRVVLGADTELGARMAMDQFGAEIRAALCRAAGREVAVEIVHAGHPGHVLHYAADKTPFLSPGLQDRPCKVLAMATGPGPRNALVELDNGTRVVVPRRNARRAA